MAFLKKTHTSNSDASHVYANDLENRIDESISVTDLNIVNLQSSTSSAREDITDIEEILDLLQLDYIVERTANYKKWASGKLEMWGVVYSSLPIATASGSMFSTASNLTIDYPVTLVGSPSYINAQFRKNDRDGSVSVRSSSTTQMLVRPLITQSLASGEWTCYWKVIGSWK